MVTVIIIVLTILYGLPKPSNSAAGKLTDNDFTKQPVSDVVFTTDVLHNSPGRSRVDCSRQCVGTAKCVMYTFWYSQQNSSLTGMCRLYRKRHQQGGEVTAAPGASSYAIDKSGLCQAFSGYFLKDGLCIHLTNQSMPYANGRQTCQAKDQGHLPYAKTLDRLAIWANIFQQYGKYSVWLGADDLAVDGQFQWTDGTPLPANSSLWDPSETDNYPSHSCVDMWKADIKLLDFDCTRSFNIVCEKDV